MVLQPSARRSVCRVCQSPGPAAGCVRPRRDARGRRRAPAGAGSRRYVGRLAGRSRDPAGRGRPRRRPVAAGAAASARPAGRPLSGPRWLLVVAWPAAARAHRRLRAAGARHRQRRVPPRRAGRAAAARARRRSPPTRPDLDLAAVARGARGPGADRGDRCSGAASPRAAPARGLGRAAAAPSRSCWSGRGGAVLELADRLERERFAGLEVVGRLRDRRRPGPRRRGPRSPGRRPGRRLATVAPATAPTPSPSRRPARPPPSTCARCPGSSRARGVELLVAPGLIEVAGPRLHIRPFEGLPLLSVEQPRFEGWRRVVKGGAGPARSRPLVAAAARPGPARARRGGAGAPARARCSTGRSGSACDGRPFTMLKFRSMVVDADQRLADLRAAERLRRAAVQDARRPARHPGRPLAAPATPSTSCRSCSTCSPAPCPWSARGRRCPPRWPSYDAVGEPPAAGQARASPACGRSPAAATCPGRRPCASTCATSRTGRSPSTR